MRYSDDDFDERGILKDGRSIRVSMQMRDAAMSRSGERRQQQPPPLIIDGRTPNDPTALHRPGFRIRTGDARQSVSDAYAKADRQANHQWKCQDKETLCADCDGEGWIDGKRCDTCGGDGVVQTDDERSTSKGGGFGSGNEGDYKGTGSDAAARHRARDQAYQSYDHDLARAYRNG